MDNLKFNQNLTQQQLVEHNRKLEQEAEQRENMLEARRVTLRRILTIDAQERLNRISAVKPEKASMIEDYLLKKYGYHNQKLDDTQVKQIIEAITTMQSNKSTIKIQRKRWDDDSDDDL